MQLHRCATQRALASEQPCCRKTTPKKERASLLEAEMHILTLTLTLTLALTLTLILTLTLP